MGRAQPARRPLPCSTTSPNDSRQLWVLFEGASISHELGTYQGDQLAEILKEEGSFGALEVRVKEIWKKEEELKLEGGWHTKISLAHLGWTESFVWYVWCNIMHVRMYMCWYAISFAE